ncbi:MAG: TerC family protein [Rhodoferax sp.]
MDDLLSASFWLAVGQIIAIDIMLGGDNAVVIAMACRQLPANQRTQGIVWGTLGAIALRVVLIAFALSLLQIPYLRLLGGVLLLWIGAKLLAPVDDDSAEVPGNERLLAAIKTVIMADLVMSLDNVVAIAGAASNAGSQHQLGLVVFGLLVSIPIIVGGSQLVLRLMDRYPWVLTLGAMLLGWIAGTLINSDSAVNRVWPQGSVFAGPLGVLLVLAWGRWRHAGRGLAQSNEKDVAS